MSIGVMGEALIDLIGQADGSFRPYLGGSPVNVAIALGCQGAACSYLAPLSRDDFGDEFYQRLQDSGVSADNEHRSNRPTSLAMVRLSSGGQPSYTFYREGVADRDYDVPSVVARMPGDMTALHAGSLALVPDDQPRIRELFESFKARGVAICMDANMRPGVVDDVDSYIAGVRALFPLCDLVKASDEDLELLGLHGDLPDIAKQLREEMGGGLVALTAGAEGALMYNDSGLVQRPGFRVSQVVDAVGCGDCFQAGMLGALFRAGVLDPNSLSTLSAEILDDVVQHASATAAINVTRAGCQPPSLEEVEQFLKDSA